MDLRKYEAVRTLRVPYTQTEQIELGKQLAECHNDSAALSNDLDRVKSEFKNKQAVIDSKIGTLSTGLSTGYAMKDVRCKWEIDQPVPNKKQLRRLDTSEIIETVEMTEADKQAALPFTEVDAAASEAAQAAKEQGDVDAKTDAAEKTDETEEKE